MKYMSHNEKEEYCEDTTFLSCKYLNYKKD